MTERLLGVSLESNNQQGDWFDGLNHAWEETGIWMLVSLIVYPWTCLFLDITSHAHTRMCTHTHIHVCMLSCFRHVQLFESLWTIACQAPLFMGFSSQEYGSGLLFPTPGNLPNLEIKPKFLVSLHWQVGSLSLALPGKPYIYITRVTVVINKSERIQYIC